METLKVFEAFAGYGSQAMALKRLNIPFKVVGISEIDKYALQAYNAVHGNASNYGDICKIDWGEVPDFDLFTYSFPCTDISLAGLQKGFDEGTGTRSGLLWECKKAIEIKRPKYLLMENVKALLGDKFSHTFRQWQSFLTSLGYSNNVNVLNAKDFGVPQNRERVFMVSILGDEWFNFPEPVRLKRCLGDILEDKVDSRYFLSQKLIDGYLKHRERSEQKGRGFKFEPRDISKAATCITTHAGARNTDNYIDIRQVREISETEVSCNRDFEPKILGYTRDSKGRVSSYHEKDVANTIHTSTGGGGNTDQFIIQRSRGFNKGGAFDISPTITSNAWQDNNYCYDKTYIRKLTPRECFRLMGVCEADIDKIQASGISDTQQYKMAGNSIVVACLEGIFRQLFCKDKKRSLTLFG